MTIGQQIIDEALEKSGGDRDLVAIALQVARSTVDNQIFKSQELTLKWGRGAYRAPEQPETLHRPPEDIPRLNPDDKAMVQAIIKEDSLLKEGLDKLGLSPVETALAVQLSGFHQNCFVQSVQISGAGMTRIGIKIGTQIDEISKRLDIVREEMLKASGPITRAAFMEEEKYLLQAYVDMTDQVRRISDTAHRGMMLQAMIRYKLTMHKNKEKRLPAKPGFSAEIPV